MLSLNLSSFALPRFLSTRFFVADAQAASPSFPVDRADGMARAPELVSPYDAPPADLDQRVRALGEW
ncbi:hypothetical protein [Acidovorax sp. PRC11]|uniref:hypothetical protein n=1 Tax=Acidovorax sp. PRC11 TaxID=2962592 RepID=UPI0028820A3E|nr:hypothetical protein [Acidovorax sp. PRC11]MDT0138514.1 hypothetical protein [Acidovorax sp. PRC11]